MFALRNLAADPDAAKVLAHSSVIDPTILAVLTRPRLKNAAHSRFLAQLGSGEPLPVARDLIPGMFYDYFRMCRRLSRPEHPKFHSVDSFVAAHDEVAHRITEICATERRRLVFPAPPVPGTSTIVPIASAEDLYTEAREQRNCVASFAGAVAAGAFYIYRLLTPERATVALRRTGRTWVLDEVAGPGNRPVSDAGHAEVASWLGIDVPF